MNITLSAETDKLFPAYVKFHAQLESVLKGKKVNAGKVRYKYADLASLQDYVRPLLAENGLAISQPCTGDSVTTLLIHDSGQYLGGSTAVKVDSSGSKAQGSAITYARRYGLASLLDLAQDDDDGVTADGYNGIRRPKAGAAQAASAGAPAATQGRQSQSRSRGSSGSSGSSANSAAGGVEALRATLTALNAEDRDGHLEILNQAKRAGLSAKAFSDFKDEITAHYKG